MATSEPTKETIRRLSKWGLLYIWEPIINHHLIKYAMIFDQLICVKKSELHPLIYSGYFTVHNYSEDYEDVKFCQYIVQFSNEGKVLKRRLLTWLEEYSIVISLTPKHLIIFDNRSYFPWLDNSVPSP
jgi:hypothetical protein